MRIYPYATEEHSLIHERLKPRIIFVKGTVNDVMTAPAITDEESARISWPCQP